MENKPLFEPQKKSNILFDVMFKSGKPFKSGVNEKYNKPWHGYDVASGGTEYTWFASEAVHLLIGLAGVKDGDECTIEFKSGTSNAGNNYNIWLLNGKSAKDFAQENAVTPEPSMTTPAAEPVMDPMSTPIEATPSSEPSDAKKLAIMWDAHIKANPQIKAQTEAVTDDDLPF